MTQILHIPKFIFGVSHTLIPLLPPAGRHGLVKSTYSHEQSLTQFLRQM
jgi:hypothetical protein